MGARALVKRVDAPKPESSLIITPETVEAKPSPYAVVIAVGKLVQGGFAPADVVLLHDYAGAPCNVELDGEVIEAVVVSEDDVLCVVEGL
jgi:co-chaperonin GroES (HSP10)